MKSQVPQEVKRVRQDISDFVWHFTRRDNTDHTHIRSIIEEQGIRPSLDKATDSSVISFTDAPLREFIGQNEALFKHDYKRLSLYGVGVKKEWLYEQGGLPVIYQPRKLLKELNSEFAYRHVDFDLSRGIDYTWQREWRIKSDFLTLPPDAIFVFEELPPVHDLAVIYSVDVDVSDGEAYFVGGLIKKMDFILLEDSEISNDSSIVVFSKEIVSDSLYSPEDLPNLDYEGP